MSERMVDDDVLAALDASIRADLERGVSREKVRATVLAAGWTQEEAEGALRRVEAKPGGQAVGGGVTLPPLAPSPVCVPRVKDGRAAAGTKHMIYGGLWCVGGTVVTALTYSAAANAGGGRYVIAWGAIVFGGLEFLQGLFMYLRAQR